MSAARLQAVFDRLNAQHFDGRIRASIVWGRRVRRAPGRRTTAGVIQLGCYDFAEKQIRIHPTLSRSWVPEWFLAFVIYHEMLHELHPPKTRNGRRVLHPPAFRQDERSYPDHERGMRWEKRNLYRLLRY